MQQQMQQVREWWQRYTGEEDTPFDGDTPSWVVSLLVHVCILLGLALTGMGEIPEPIRNFTIIESPKEIDEDVLIVPQEVAISETPQETIGAESEMNDEVAQALAPTLSDVSVVPVEADPDLVSEIELEPIDAMPTAQSLDANIIVKGAVGVGMTGAVGAVDRLTAEIRNSLDERPTVVCWLFDQSGSLAPQRKVIAKRLGRVFAELGVRDASDKKLTNSVIAFGQSVSLLTKKPTSDVDEVIQAVESIAIDSSGVEITFEAIHKAAELMKVYRTSSPKKNVMIIVFTDEVGNDQAKTDMTSKYCTTIGVPVYVVGVPAPFGMRDVKIKYIDPDPKYSQETQWAEIEQGPESMESELVKIHTSRMAEEAIDSGYGPFSLSRLCRDTGGIYFCVHPSRDTKGRVADSDVEAMSSRLRYFYDPDVMRRYQPDYISMQKYKQLLASNKARQALVEAAKASEIEPMQAPQTKFERRSDGELAKLLGDAQQSAAKLEPKISALYSVLQQGEKDREKLEEPRWKAGYDLAMGRVLAVKVRTEAYNMMLAQAKAGMKFERKDSDTWEIVPDNALTVGSQIEKQAKQAKMYLERVVKEHPKTPWAMIASEELKIPLGYRWEEAHTGVNDPKMAAGGDNNNPAARADDKKKMLAKPMLTRPLPKL